MRPLLRRSACKLFRMFQSTQKGFLRKIRAFLRVVTQHGAEAGKFPEMLRIQFVHRLPSFLMPFTYITNKRTEVFHFFLHYITKSPAYHPRESGNAEVFQ